MRNEIVPVYELHFVYPCGGYISRGGEDTGAFLQGDEYYQLEDELEGLWKMVRWKKMGQRRACGIQDSILSEYCEE